ncbi:hypothetical protein PybrP1_010386 [[Pythium] brassicae (nom. inval.)]|nr:hypothetical protein PybrP1_010386 [[Pythium] brassicae (nom. inval.)]
MHGNSGGRGFGGRRGGGGRGYSYSHSHSHSGGGGRGSYWFKGEGYNDHEAVSVDEHVVGISGFLSPARRGFGGLVKQRFSDFMVRELARGSGQPVALVSLAKKKKHASVCFQELVAAFVFDAASGAEHKAAAPVLRALGDRLGRRGRALELQGRKAADARDARTMVALVTAELGKKMGKDFADFVERVTIATRGDEERRAQAIEAVAAVSAVAPPHQPRQPEEEEPLVFYIGGLNEKRERVFLHETMRRYGKALVVADTITSEDQSQVIRVRRAFAPGETKKGERDPRKSWPIDQPEYLQFVLYRRNKDITAVLNQIASVLKVSPSAFSFADPKEKRGIVTQLCTAYRVPAPRLQALQKLSGGKPLDDFQYLIGGNLKYVSEKLGPGDCAGNSFGIVVRALADADLTTPAELDATLTHWRDTGFINFFGLPRFGSSATPFHLVGRAVLRKDFKLAVLLLLRPQDGEASKVREAREHFRQHKDVAAALRMLPPYLLAERAVLDGLLQHGIDANELAFRNVPLSYRSAYVDAYLAYVWNEMASLRIAQLPRDRAVAGDLVFARADAVNDDNNGDDDAEVREPAVKKQKRAPSVAAPPAQRVIVVTEANAAAYGIEDVVLPLPGHSVELPTHEVGAAYQKMLTTDGVDMASWLGASSPHQYPQLGGSYRHVVKKPFNVSGHVLEYENMNTPLQLTDVDRLLGRTLSVRPAAPATVTPAATASSGGAEEKKKLQRALVLNFSLDHGADATIALRELMKQSSSMHVQWQLADKAQGGGGKKAPATAAAIGSSDAKWSGGGALQSSAVSRGKRPKSGSVLVGATVKTDKKIVAQKKTQVSIGRPGFSLGKH